MSLNRLYNIFKTDRLERADVEAYSQNADSSTKNAIEQKAMSDSFDNDAMDGWEELSFDTGVMANLDKKFAPSSGVSLYKIIGGTALVSSVIVAILYFTVFKEPSNSTIKQMDHNSTEVNAQEPKQMIILDESDVSLPQPIEQMVHAPKAEQVAARQISKEFQEIISFRIESPNLPTNELSKVKPLPTPQPEIVKDHKSAKEIYLHSMKLVDYRKYREKPEIKTKQLMLTGVPANKEEEYSEEEDPVWRDVDVPYIEYIDKSISTFERGNYKKALSRFETILETYSDDVNANFYAGICLFNLQEYNSAIDHFSNCLEGKFSNFDEEAQWMIAECYEKSGAKSKAKELYELIAAGNGFYANQAKDRIK